MTRLVEAWDRFWFQPESTSTVALWRISFGIVTLVWALALAPDLFTFYSETGLEPKQPRGWGWGLLAIFSSDAAVLAVYAVLIVSSIALTLGCFSRLASVLVFVALLSFQRREPYVLNSGDVVLRIIAFFMIFAPTGATFSVDAWRRSKERFWRPPLHSPWPLRLMQVQLSVIYLSAVWSKLQGDAWNNGTAVYYAMSVNEIHRFPIPGFMLDTPLIVNLMTYGTVFTEAAIGILVWNRAARPFVLAAGVLLHLGIDYAIAIVLFSQAIFVAYTAFVSPAWLDRQLAALRERLRSSRALRLRRLAAV